MDALVQWQVAQAHLKGAVYDFLNACTTLQNAISGSLDASDGPNPLEQTIMKLHSHIGSVDLVERKLAESRAVVNCVLNTSTSLVPINVLPLEVLSRVFLFATLPFSCAERFHGRNQLLVIPAVCTRWRQLATSTRSLWSHIDIHLGRVSSGSDLRSLQIARLCLERANGVPLHIHFRAGNYPIRNFTTQIIPTLKPHAASISSLIFSTYFPESVVQAVMVLCSCRDVSGSPATLVLSGVWSLGGPERLGWPTGYLQGLFELQLNSLPDKVCPTLDQLLSIFSASPLLHTLRLRDMTILPGHDQGVGSISLPNLKLLDLAVKNQLGLQQLLAALCPGTLELDFRLALPQLSSEEFVTTLNSFFRRSSVSFLCLRCLNLSHNSQLAQYFSYLPQLRALFLNCARDHDLTSLSALTVRTEAEAFIPRCPNLRTLCVMQGNMDRPGKARMKQVVKSYFLSKVVFACCSWDTTLSFSDDDNPEPGRGIYGDMDNEYLVDWVRPLVKTVIDDSADDEDAVVPQNDQDWDLYIQKHVDEELE